MKIIVVAHRALDNVNNSVATSMKITNLILNGWYLTHREQEAGRAGEATTLATFSLPI